MSLLERAGLALAHRLDPELAHGLALKALRTGLVPLPGPVTSPRLAISPSSPSTSSASPGVSTEVGSSRMRKRCSR